MSIETIKLALEALERGETKLRYEAITALRAAIEQAKEPVAWVNPKWLNPKTRHWTNDTILHKPIAGWIPLYTATSQWHGLTDDEIALICGECAASHADDIRYARAIEAKLRDKNA